MVLKILRCLICNWEWSSRVDRPRKCPNPKCQSYDWDIGINNISPTRKQKRIINYRVTTELINDKVITKEESKPEIKKSMELD